MDRKSLLACYLVSMALACSTTGPTDVGQLDLPGDNVYPESLGMAQDGTLFVGSLATGQVLKFAPGATSAEVFIPPGTMHNVAGLLVDDSESALYVCAVDLSTQNPSLPAVRSFKLSDGLPLATYPFSGAGFCNDFAFDGQHNLYVTDSAGKIYRLKKGEAALALWSSDSALAPSSPQGFGANGIVWDGKASLYVNTFSDGRLLRFDIHPDGSAGAAQTISVSPALVSPDGMRLLDENTLLLVEGAGRLSRVSLSGTTATATALKDGLLGPTSVVRYEQYAWVSEGQLAHFFGLVSGPPRTPFRLRRIGL